MVCDALHNDGILARACRLRVRPRVYYCDEYGIIVVYEHSPFAILLMPEEIVMCDPAKI